MAAVAAIAGVGMMVCCSSSVAALMMGGEETPAAATGAGAGAGAAAALTGVSGQYVELAFPADTNPKFSLTPHEVRVFDKAGTNMALNKTVVVSGTHGGPNGGLGGSMAVDGDDDTFWHSLGGPSSIKIDLGAVKEIAKIEIKNTEGTTEYNGVAANARMSGGKATVTIYGADGTTVVDTTPEISTVAAKYTIDLTASSPVWA